MTSVQNLRQLSNGNKVIILLVILIGISSCSAKKISTTRNNKVEILEPNSAVKSKRYEDSISKKAESFDIDDDNKPTKPTKIKDSKTNTSTTPTNVLNNDPNRIYTIAVILPFYLDQIPLGQYVDDSTKQLSVDSKNAMDFYLGCQMAREKFESSDLQANVYFLDNKDDSLTTASLFTQRPFPNVDYIVGPLYFTNLKPAADFARNHQIPIISPVANSMYIKDNPYYFNGFPSLKSQYEFILSQTKSKFPVKTLEVIYDGKDSLAESINLLKNIADKNYGYSNIKYTSLRATDDIAKTMMQADTLSERVVLIYSSKETYIKPVIAKLKAVKNHLQVFTSAPAKSIKLLSDSKNPQSIYTVSSYNTDSPNYSAFAANYEEKYMKKPCDVSAQGFDVMMHLLNTIDKHQTLQDNPYSNSSDFDNTQTKFQFKPVLNKNGGIDYYDNTFMYLYKYVNGTFILTTP